MIVYFSKLKKLEVDLGHIGNCLKSAKCVVVNDITYPEKMQYAYHKKYTWYVFDSIFHRIHEFSSFFFLICYFVQVPEVLVKSVGYRENLYTDVHAFVLMWL